MTSANRFLGKAEHLAVLKDLMPDANRSQRRAAANVYGPLSQRDLDAWAELNEELLHEFVEPLRELAATHGLLEGRRVRLGTVTPAQFTAWSRSMSERLRLEETTARLAVAITLGREFSPAMETPSATVQTAAELSIPLDAAGREPSEAAELVENGAPQAPHAAQSEGGVKDAPHLPFGAWLTELSIHPAEWPGWDHAANFAARVQELAASNLQARADTRRRFEDLLAAIDTNAPELEYLEKTEWRSWVLSAPASIPSASVLDHLEVLVTLLHQHAELRRQSPSKVSDARHRQQALDGFLAEIDVHYMAAESELASLPPARANQADPTRVPFAADPDTAVPAMDAIRQESAQPLRQHGAAVDVPVAIAASEPSPSEVAGATVPSTDTSVEAAPLTTPSTDLSARVSFSGSATPTEGRTHELAAFVTFGPDGPQATSSDAAHAPSIEIVQFDGPSAQPPPTEPGVPSGNTAQSSSVKLALPATVGTDTAQPPSIDLAQPAPTSTDTGEGPNLDFTQSSDSGGDTARPPSIELIEATVLATDPTKASRRPISTNTLVQPSALANLSVEAPPATRPPDMEVSMPPEIATFASFADAFSVAPDGTAVPAAWRTPAFQQDLIAKFEAELARRPVRFLRLWLLAGAGTGKSSDLPSAEDVEQLAAWWSGTRATRAHDGARADVLRNAYQNAALGPTARWRCTVLLMALSTPGARPLDAALIDEIVHQIELGDHGLEVALTELLVLQTRVPDPVDWLRRTIEPVQEVSLAAADQRLSKQRRELFEYFCSVMQAGGGKIQQTHCREAWRAFVERVLPELRPLFPEAHRGEPHWDAAGKHHFVSAIEAIHAEVADHRGARLKDRVRMDRIAQRLAGYARAVNDAMADVDVARQRGAGRIGDVAVRTDVFRQLAEGTPPPGAVGLLREILVRAVFHRATDDVDDPLDILEQDLRATPDLLELMPPVAGTLQSPELGRATDILDRRAAAALLLASRDETPSISPLPELLRATGRNHLLAKVVALCPEDDQLRIHADQDTALENARRLLTQIEAVRLRLSDAASPLSQSLAEVHRQGLLLLDAPPGRMRMFAAWLTTVLAFARAQLDAAGRAILADAEQQGQSVLDAVRPLVQEQRLAEALTVLRGRVPLVGRSVRLTQPRRAAASAFSDPARRLAEPDVAQRVSRWLAPPGDLQQERALRTEFAKLVLEDLYPKEKDQNCISVRCDDIRRRLDERQLNPCYVPQLQRFGHVSIPRIVVRPSDPQFPIRAADAAGQYPNDLVILLAPRITRERRDAVLQELRRRSATAAVVDDLDLCRILNPGGTRPDAILGLLEVALEQQRWTAISPFGVVDGQHVQLEMYVGRRDEARDLAHTSRYSRLFSGRKLGKSALLRYVEQQYDGRALPSGKRLRVLYVSAVGIETDIALVDQIVGCLGHRCDFDPEHAPRPGEEPAARLQRVLARHIQTHPDESLLVVLDEADAFVEAELDRYQRRPHESCLSWVMSRRIESARDTQGLPRVRFVFTGYRVTNTREGVWFNWSEVLQLVPLPVDEAAELVAAPLARLGIDASEQAAVIAHRCGYQPAVLLRFGERLLVRLEQQSSPSTRAHRQVQVAADDVAATFEEDAIQDEIRRVTSNNFRDNDIGAVLFGALLSIYLAMGPAAILDAAEDRLLDRLRALDGADLGWMAQEGGNLREQIKGKLRDLVARQLLVERRLPGDRTGYGLKFPHHLTVLAPLAREDRIREAIRRIRSGVGSAAQQASRGLLSWGDFDVVRELVTTKPDPTLPIAPIVGHLWTLPPAEMLRILHRGIFDPLNLDRSRVFDAREVEPVLARILGDAASLAFHGVRPEMANTLIAGRVSMSPMPLLVGGVDLLRHAVRTGRNVQGGAVHLEAVGFGRLLRGHLAWWFERARGFNFSQPDAIERIFAATSGIPLLVSALDHNLTRHDPHGGGLEVTSEILTEGLDELRRQFGEIAAMLTSGPETQLAPRELVLLRMLAVAARSSPAGTTSWEDLSEQLWPEYAKSLAAGSPLASAPPIGPEGLLDDEIALEVLEKSGLVPSRLDVPQGLALDRLGAVRPDDALVELMAHLPP